MNEQQQAETVQDVSIDTLMASIEAGDMVVLHLSDSTEVYKLPVLNAKNEDGVLFYTFGEIDEETGDPTSTPNGYRWYWDTDCNALTTENQEARMPDAVVYIEIQKQEAEELAALYEKTYSTVH